MPDAMIDDPAAALRRWRDEWPDVRPAREDEGFEIGLCMAGAVSAGAYTAGVLDFLVEALDAFQAERDARVAAGRPPLHRPLVSVLGGASAGGMCAAIGAVFLDTDFPPVRQDTPAELRRRNPLWRAWVEDVDIGALLGKDDVAQGGQLASLLDCTALERTVDSLLLEREGMAPRRRPWLASPLRAVLALSNLRGVPYALRFEGSGFRHWMAQHADHVSFTIDLPPEVEAARGDPPRIGEAALARVPPADPAERRGFLARRDAFKAVALGTGSFPVALAPRVLSRDAGHYLYRAALAPGGPLARKLPIDPFPDWARLLQPAWNPRPAAGEAGYRALCVDGGALNNEPFDLVRRMISGYVGRPPQEASKAQRAILMVDPFVNPRGDGPDACGGLAGSAMPLLNALVANSRFKPEDLALAADPAIGSRFIIAPSRGGAWEAEGAIAAGHLNGFLGFFAKRYREHDFFLGRRNAQAFLRNRFVLPSDNPVFTRGGWSADDVAEFRVKRDGPVLLPVVPLCGERVTRDEPLPRWPAGDFEAGDVRWQVAARVGVVGRALRDILLREALGGPGFWPWAGRNAVRAAWPLVLPRVVDAVMAKIARAVDELDRKAPSTEG